jgi:hypothetical protein
MSVSLLHETEWLDLQHGTASAEHGLIVASVTDRWGSTQHRPERRCGAPSPSSTLNPFPGRLGGAAPFGPTGHEEPWGLGPPDEKHDRTSLCRRAAGRAEGRGPTPRSPRSPDRGRRAARRQSRDWRRFHGEGRARACDSIMPAGAHLGTGSGAASCARSPIRWAATSGGNPETVS